MLDFLTWSLSSAWRLKVAQNTFGFRFVVKWAYDTTNVGAYTWGVGGRVGWNVDLGIKAGGPIFAAIIFLHLWPFFFSRVCYE